LYYLEVTVDFNGSRPRRRSIQRMTGVTVAPCMTTDKRMIRNTVAQTVSTLSNFAFSRLVKAFRNVPSSSRRR
jgi:hypothetical protein